MGELKLENLDLPQNEESLFEHKLSLVSSRFEQDPPLKLRKPNEIQSWLIDVIASALSFVIVFCVLSVVGILFKDSANRNKN